MSETKKKSKASTPRLMARDFVLYWMQADTVDGLVASLQADGFSKGWDRKKCVELAKSIRKGKVRSVGKLALAKLSDENKKPEPKKTKAQINREALKALVDNKDTATAILWLKHGQAPWDQG